MCVTLIGWRHLVNAYGVMASCGWLQPLSAASMPVLYLAVVVLGLRAGKLTSYRCPAWQLMCLCGWAIWLNRIKAAYYYYYYYHVLLPVGMKPNWSSRRLLGKTDLSQCWTTNFSTTRDIIGVTEYSILCKALRVCILRKRANHGSQPFSSYDTRLTWHSLISIVVTIPDSS